MKKAFIVGLIPFIFFFFSICQMPMNVRAATNSSNMEGGLDPNNLDFDEVDQILAESDSDGILHAQTKVKTVGELLQALLSGNVQIVWQDWGAAFGSLLLGNLQTYLHWAIRIIGLILLSQLFNSLTLQFGDNAVGELGFLCVYVVLILVLLESFQVAYEETGQSLETIRNLSLYMMPAMAAVTMAAGFPLSSIWQGEVLTGGFSLILTVMRTVFAAGVLWITVLETVNFIGKRPALSQLTALGRTLVEKGVKTLSMVYLLAMGLLGAVTPTADQMVYKVSNTLLSAVPVVGSAMSKAMDSVMAGSVLIKNGIGVTGCIVLLCICMLPIARLVAIWLLYRLMAAFLSPIADERIIRLLTVFGKSTAILVGILVSGMVVFTGTVGIFIITLHQ